MSAALGDIICNIPCRFVASITLLTHAGLSLLDQFAGFWTQRSFGVCPKPETCTTLAVFDQWARCMTAKQGMISVYAAECLAQDSQLV